MLSFSSKGSYRIAKESNRDEKTKMKKDFLKLPKVNQIMTTKKNTVLLRKTVSVKKVILNGFFPNRKFYLI
jgi:3-hydroxymyristoyl/3-hydroxydecanoyl-(acyl carrier protein) dehydratase